MAKATTEAIAANDAAHKKALKLIANGVKPGEAIKQAGMTEAAFYARQRKNGIGRQISKKTTRTRRQGALSVEAIPMPTAKPFLIYGSAEELAAFARGFQ